MKTLEIASQRAQQDTLRNRLFPLFKAALPYALQRANQYGAQLYATQDRKSVV